MSLSNNSNAEMANKLQALRDEYAARLPEQLQALQQEAAQLLEPERQATALQHLQRLLHRMAGSAGSFGFGELGKQAKQLELQVSHWLDAVPVEVLNRGQLQEFLVALNSLATQGVPSASAVIMPAASLREQTLRQTNICLLEDDPAVADEVAAMLRHFGHNVSLFRTLAEAEAAILANPPDFIIADIVFLAEGRESPDAIAKLQNEIPASVPVIFMSSRNGFTDYLAAVRAGAVGYFTKPLDVVQLVDFLELYLESHRNTPYRVLIVDDDQALAQHYQWVLRSAGMLVEVVSHPEALIQRLNEFHPELILLDLNMPDCSGTELAKVVRLNSDWLRIPITYISSETDIDKRIQAMGQAGDDFLTKPISDRELISAVSVRAARSRQLGRAIDRDSLTGLFKHSRIKEQVEIELARARRNQEWFSVVMIDLDKFKVVNDTYGHPTGDRVIKALSHLLRQRLRKTDAIGRYGGEEFVAVLPKCSAEEARRLTEDVRRNFKELAFQFEGQTFHVTLSAGISFYQPGSEVRADQLLQRADDALYTAKRKGRDCVEVAES